MALAEREPKPAPCWVFIDYSNLFINGKKFFAKHQNLCVESDPRFRIDIGKLVDRVVGERTMSFGKLYGSEPKSLDSVWKAVRDQKLEVQVFERSKGGEEKEVDTAITADIVEECIVHKKKAKKGGIFIIISGDRDFCSSIEKLLKYEWLVEVYSWKACLSEKIKELTKTEKKQFIKTRCLEELIFGTTKNTSPCVFKKYVWNPEKVGIPRHRTMVLCFDVNVKPSECKTITDKVTEKFKRPWMYCLRNYGDEYVLMVITCHEIDDINEIVNWYTMLKVVQDWGFRKCSNVISLVTYYNQFNGDYDEDFAWQWKDENDLGGAKKWIILRPKIANSKDISSLPCRYHFSCNQGGKCGRQHSDDEKRFFKEHLNGKHHYKSKPCIYGSKWRKCKYENNSLLCPYAHNVEETRCYVCGKNGIHWMVDCPEGDNQE